MPVIGLTGGVATGKSTIAALFRDLGAIVLSADEAARAVTAPGSPVLHEIAAAFGEEYLLPDGGLDRARLGAFIFSHPDARQRLEQITHPPILRLLQEQIDRVRREHPGDPPILIEMPLLFEAGLESWFNRVVVVAASQRAQVRRLARRNGFDAREARRRIEAQMPLSEKIARAHVVIWNQGSRAQVRTRVREAWKALCHEPTMKTDARPRE